MNHQSNYGSRNLTLLGMLIIATVISVGFLPCTEAAWLHGGRALFPILAGGTIGAAMWLIILGQFDNRKH